MFDILTENFLSSISVESSLGVNLANYSMSKFTSDDLDNVLRDLRFMQKNYEYVLINVLKPNSINYRIKSVESVKLKILKYKSSPRKALLCFNDLLGLRVVCENYPSKDIIPDYFQVIDLTTGKDEDDGYRALHLYYKKSNRHYPIEIQIWKKGDENFINWSHKYCYKTENSNVLKRLRLFYDIGRIISEDDFKREFDIACACNLFNDIIRRKIK